MTARNSKKGVVPALLLASASLIAASPANAADSKPVAPPANSAPSTAPAPPSPGPGGVDPDAAKAMARLKGIKISVARERLARERDLDARGDRIARSLDGRTGGTYLDANGNLVVTTLDAASKAVVTNNDARAKVVDDSSARLEAIMEQLDRQAAKTGAGGVHGWFIDVPTNSVVVTVSEGTTDAGALAITRLAATFGDSVRIERKPADQAPKPAEWMVGGFQFVLPSGGTCSVGFNTRDAANRDVVLTAGHCVTQAGSLSRNGYLIGAPRTANYPNDDFGTFWNSYPGYWQPSPSIYKYDGTYARVMGQWDNPTIGATVCKSGRTTGYTCGKITALNQTVTYTGGYILHGLVRHNACVEPGDSGGSNISAGQYALGLTSGAATTAAKQCLSKVGQANVSYYQPVGEALTRNGLRLLL